MQVQTLRWAVVWIGAVVAMASAGCGGGSETTGFSQSTGTGSSGGGGGDVITDKGHPATETVSAGDVTKSPNYIMISSFGQPTQNQGKTTSPSYGLQGGIVGATGSAK